MKMTSAATYALQALTFLADTQGEPPVASHVIAGQCSLPEPFLLKILKSLVTARLVTSSKGPFGGYVLARRPVNITLLEIIEAVDGPITPHVPFRISDHSRLHRRCKSLCEELVQNTRSKLLRIRLSELV